MHKVTRKPNRALYKQDDYKTKLGAHRGSTSTSKEMELIEQRPTRANDVERPQLGRQQRIILVKIYK